LGLPAADEKPEDGKTQVSEEKKWGKALYTSVSGMCLPPRISIQRDRGDGPQAHKLTLCWDIQISYVAILLAQTSVPADSMLGYTNTIRSNSVSTNISSCTYPASI
jgi:hypothetical protein